ncbi:MAG: response regulator transcription factor [Bacteroidales bacterium]|nr:response regulator transcription factor [Bacteroidales bacterium]
METLNILIADDHEVIHNGIRDILRSYKRYKISGNAYDGEEAIDKALKLRPDIIFMDISMPKINGIEAIRVIATKLPDTKIIALTQHEENEYVLQILRAGGDGYLLKNSNKEEFIDAIESVIQGKRYLSNKLSERMINNVLEQESKQEDSDQHEIQLTRREIEIIQKIADDKSNQEIADELHISIRTVETHRRNLMQKLKVNTLVGLLKYASQHNIITFK